MAGNRRVIYIKNPSSGSHFRTIGGPGGGSGKGKGSTTPPSQTGIPNRNGYLPGRTAPGTWQVRNPVYDYFNNYAGQPLDFFGGPPNGGPGIGPVDTSSLELPERDRFYAREFKNWELVAGFGILGVIIWGGVAPLTAATLAPLGVPSLALQWVGPLAKASWKANALVVTILRASGHPVTVNDASVLRWDKDTGGWVTDYPDLSSYIEASWKSGNFKDTFQAPGLDYLSSLQDTSQVWQAP